ncbi:hypothetical protein DBZ47_24945 [Escherichia coli]|nr:hypothetical protein DBZ47_24945 [Escherichia coli]PUD90734.1 hypothetical protein DBX29_24960 [Escherichia coli]
MTPRLVQRVAQPDRTRWQGTILYSTEVSVSLEQKVVSLVVLTNSIFFSLPISYLLATAIPVRGAKF